MTGIDILAWVFVISVILGIVLLMLSPFIILAVLLKYFFGGK